LPRCCSLPALPMQISDDKDNHVEGVGGHTLNELQKQGKPTAADVKKERDLQKNWDREKDNHMEGVGGHATP
jgi:hypothetical protein